MEIQPKPTVPNARGPDRKDADRFFLCCGIPKSGTTFLQRMLDMHPGVSCPSEQSLETIARQIEEFAQQYNRILRVFDRRTGGQGARMIDETIGRQLLRDLILSLSRAYAGERRVHGLNDNSVFFDLEFYDDLFGHPPIICIFRNPVDRAISAWSHNQRLAREERNMAADHLRVLENPEGTMEGYVRMQVEKFGKVVDRFLAYADGRPNIFSIRYEKLVADKKNELERLFAVLGVETTPDLLDSIERRSSRENMAARSAAPAFFGNGESRESGSDACAAFRARALSACAEELERLG